MKQLLLNSLVRVLVYGATALCVYHLCALGWRIESRGGEDAVEAAYKGRRQALELEIVYMIKRMAVRVAPAALRHDDHGYVKYMRVGDNWLRLVYPARKATP